MQEIWTPAPRELPDERKADGGSYFDDELRTKEEVAAELGRQVKELLMHLNARPDHTVYVGSVEDREHMRSVFNWWKSEGALTHNPNIRIDYGIPEGGIRVME